VDSPVERLLLAPTLSWINAGDAWLQAQSVAGVVLSILLLLGAAPLVVTPLLWLLYLSLAAASRNFLAYQWDSLLLEAGFLAIFVAPAVMIDRQRDRVEPPRLAVWLFRWLIFRFMLASGAVKLTSGDPTWSGLTAMAFHYETQPLPTPVAWYAHQLPLWFHKGSTAVVLALELIAPLLMLGPRRLRLTAALLVVALLAMIALTGNYAFFGLLTSTLCLFLVDDATFGPRAAAPPAPPVPPAFPAPPAQAWHSHDRGRFPLARLRTLALAVVVIVTLPVSLFAMCRAIGIATSPPRAISWLAGWTSPLHLVNSYGLFAVMTTSRPEIVVEGSEDGVTWQAYEFRYKPGDPERRPPWVAPHQPRLDWDMWFAALDDYSAVPWFGRFLARLLEGSPDVLKLLAATPFGDRRPQHVRAVLYEYRFSRAAEAPGTGGPGTGRHGTQPWWTRERVGAYSPVLSNPP
jgi:hypothetical protein